jgi:ADP-ribosylglycohydrolase
VGTGQGLRDHQGCQNIFHGGDADTMACIAGGIGEAMFGKLPEMIRGETLNRLAPEFLEPLAVFEKHMQVTATRGAGAPTDG